MNIEELQRKYGKNKIEEIDTYRRTMGLPEEKMEELVQENEKIADELLLDINRIANGIRQILINGYGDVVCTKRNYMYQLSNSVGAHQNPLACDSLWPSFIPDNGTVADYLHAADFDTLIRVYMLWPKATMVNNAITPVWENASGNLFALVRIQNTIFGGGSCIGGFNQGATYDGHGNCVINGCVDNSLAANRANIAFLLENMDKDLLRTGK